MILPLIVTVSLVAMLLARLNPRWDAGLAWLVGTVLAACAGLFTQGFDHEQYLVIVEFTRQLADQGIAVRLAAAKDPLFLFIIEFAGALSDDVQLVFVLVAALSVATKVIATAALPARRTQFMALYAIFVAPGLELAAIRAGLALGLVMLGYTLVLRVRWRVLWVSLGLASHISVLVIIAGRIWPRWWRPILVGLILLGPVVVPAIAEFVEDDIRYVQYLDNPGTPLAFMMPVMTLLSLLLLSRSVRGLALTRHPLLSKNRLTASYFVVATSLVLTLPVVTAATRVMELAWVLLLPQLLARDRLFRHAVHASQAASWIMMIGVLSLSNLLRGTWAVLL